MASGSGQSSLDGLLDGVRERETNAGTDVSITPALDKLNEDQRQWLQRWTIEGYTDRRDLIVSLHQMQFWSLGRVPDGWFVEVCSRPVPLSILITSPNRREWREDPVDQHTAEQERRLWAAKYIRPAFRAAYRTLRKNAQQYTNKSERVEDASETQYFAMRPALDDLYQKQSDLLLSLLDGFEDMAAVDDWLSRLDNGTLGELHMVEPDFDWKIHDSTVAQRVLTVDAEKYERERAVGRDVSAPSYNRAVDRWAGEADEHREDDGAESQPSRTM
ncbi:hypothetical protein ACFQH8_00135 [Halomicroarcula sp. GCM10025710]